jgi:hypothetical protein
VCNRIFFGKDVWRYRTLSGYLPQFTAVTAAHRSMWACGLDVKYDSAILKQSRYWLVGLWADSKYCQVRKNISAREYAASKDRHARSRNWQGTFWIFRVCGLVDWI